MTEVINKLKTDITSEAPKILEAVFEPTLQVRVTHDHSTGARLVPFWAFASSIDG